jgi:hypothetical protein
MLLLLLIIQIIGSLFLPFSPIAFSSPTAGNCIYNGFSYLLKISAYDRLIPTLNQSKVSRAPLNLIFTMKFAREKAFTFLVLYPIRYLL